MKFYTTPKGELVRDTDLKDVELPPVPNPTKLHEARYQLSEQHPRVPVVGVDTWIAPEGRVVVRNGDPRSTYYHGLRWIVEKIPAQIETPPDAMPERPTFLPNCPCITDPIEPPMPDAPEGYEFLRVQPKGTWLYVAEAGQCLSDIADLPNFAGLRDAKGRSMGVDPMWEDERGTLFARFTADRARVRPSFVMFKKEAQADQ